MKEFAVELETENGWYREFMGTYQPHDVLQDVSPIEKSGPDVLLARADVLPVVQACAFAIQV